MKELKHDTSVVSGYVKWFDSTKGFGFVVAETGGPDILLHVNVLKNFGQSSVADGARVDIVVQDTAKGVQAVEILKVKPPQLAEDEARSDWSNFETQDVEHVPLEPARVKWFDDHKGFGFANVFGSSEDVFLHTEVLRRSGLANLQPGEAIAIKVVDGKRGLMAAEVSSWENAVVDDV